MRYRSRTGQWNGGRQVDFTRYFEIDLNWVALDSPLPFDLYLRIDFKPTLFRSRGEELTYKRLLRLIGQGRKTFLVPENQREAYLENMKERIARIIGERGA